MSNGFNQKMANFIKFKNQIQLNLKPLMTAKNQK